jgi:hypothetical protein
MNWLIIILFVLGCLAVYKAFNAKDPKQKRMFGFIALFIGGLLFVLSNPGIFKY